MTFAGRRAGLARKEDALMRAPRRLSEETPSRKSTAGHDELCLPHKLGARLEVIPLMQLPALNPQAPP